MTINYGQTDPIKIESLDHLGIIMAVCETLDVENLIDKRLPPVTEPVEVPGHCRLINAFVP